MATSGKNTAPAESAQALFCALADYLGASAVDEVFDLKKFPTYLSFKKYWDENYPQAKIQTTFKSHVDADVTLTEVEKLLSGKDVANAREKDDWYKSSILIAKKLIKDINKISKQFSSIKQPSWSSVFYVRGDKSVMDNIAELYKRANEIQKDLISEGAHGIAFSNINKWSPADIYFASPAAKKQISDEVQGRRKMTFSVLNKMISKMISEGQLLPLSLKKQTKEVYIDKVNFNRPLEMKKLGNIKYGGTNDWKTYTKPKPGEKKIARYFTIYLNESKTEEVSFRHDPSSSGSFKGEIKIIGMEARSGSLNQGPIIGIFRLVDTTFASKFEKSLNDSMKQFRNDKKFYRQQLDKKIIDRKEYDFEVGALSAIDVTNNVIPLIIDWLKNKKHADDFVRVVYQYATSRSEDSAKFVIAK
jgi:hypothetical protein